ncbi:hypothetical protein C1646_687903 [Rhizophagus diaphanus]|nr:hypothetical protein C1646_687903 [Rhizophagus diaphanus] [Rhizophagus sp. MUCL 43196]
MIRISSSFLTHSLSFILYHYYMNYCPESFPIIKNMPLLKYLSIVINTLMVSSL